MGGGGNPVLDIDPDSLATYRARKKIMLYPLR